MSDRRPWSAQEREALAARYRSEGAEVLAREFGRTPASVVNAARRYEVDRDSRRWTTEDDQKIQYMWGYVTIRFIAEDLGRSRRAVWYRARALGLKSVPAGFESLSAAARRAGFDSTTLHRILIWAGHTKLRFAMSMPKPGKYQAKNIMLDPEMVDESVARWMATETLRQAAIRYGVCCQTVEKRLRALGDGVPEKPRHKTWRIPVAVVDRAMAGPGGG